jgi:hypothetical protein
MPTPTAAPTATPVPTTTSSDLPPNATPADIENGFLTNVDDLVAEANDIASEPCPDMAAAVTQNPELVPSVRGFAAALKRVGGTQTVLNTDNVKAALADMDRSVADMEDALRRCQINLG